MIDEDEAAENKNSLIIGSSVVEESEVTDKDEATHDSIPFIIGGIIILILFNVLVLVLTKRRKRGTRGRQEMKTPSTDLGIQTANLRNEIDENSLYGPRDTIYLDEVDI